MVRQIFDPFGTIESCLLISDPITKKFTGSGFVTFTETECGKAAMRELDRFDLAGNRLKVSVVDGSSSRDRDRDRDRRDRRDERRRSSERSEGSDPANGAVGRIALMAKLAHREPAAPKVSLQKSNFNLVVDTNINNLSPLKNRIRNQQHRHSNRLKPLASRLIFYLC